MKLYLLKAWGGDQEVVALTYPPDKVHDRSLHWWFDTVADREAFKQQLRGMDLHRHRSNHISLMMVEYDPMDASGNECDTHKRTVAVMKFKLPTDEVMPLEFDFGYGYPHDSARYMFEEGNYSCDCNRADFLKLDDDWKCGETIEMVEFTTEERE